MGELQLVNPVTGALLKVNGEDITQGLPEGYVFLSSVSRFDMIVALQKASGIYDSIDRSEYNRLEFIKIQRDGIDNLFVAIQGMCNDAIEDNGPQVPDINLRRRLAIMHDVLRQIGEALDNLEQLEKEGKR
jgi:hypothetical protein